jgi:hypothetical protein
MRRYVEEGLHSRIVKWVPVPVAGPPERRADGLLLYTTAEPLGLAADDCIVILGGADASAAAAAGSGEQCRVRVERVLRPAGRSTRFLARIMAGGDGGSFGGGRGQIRLLSNDSLRQQVWRPGPPRLAPPDGPSARCGPRLHAPPTHRTVTAPDAGPPPAAQWRAPPRAEPSTGPRPAAGRPWCGAWAGVERVGGA